MKFILISFCFCFCFCFEKKVSDQAVDGLLAIVGDNIITQSDFFEQLKMVSERSGINPSNMPLKYERLAENLLLNIVDQLVLLEHAKLDSNIFLEDEEVKKQLDLQISGFINNMGSVEALEKYLNKSLREIKAYYWEEIYNAMLIERFRYSLIGNISVGKKEVDSFYSIYKDSLPPVPKRADFSVLNLQFSPGKKTIQFYYTLTENIIDSLALGLATFEELVRRHSDDFASISKGGGVGETERGSFLKEYEEASFSAKIGSVVGPIKTSAGFHIIKLLDRRGEKITTQHLLKTIKPSTEDKDSLVSLIKNIHLKASETPSYLSSYIEGGSSFGISGNYENFYYEQLFPELVKIIDSASQNFLSTPFGFSNGTVGLVFVYEKHGEEIATLENSYKYISDLAKEKKASEFVEGWLIGAKKNVYINMFVKK